LIASKHARPEEILALTFTEKAAVEMAERVDQLIPYGYAESWIGTFHAFGDRVLREGALESGLNPEFQVLARPEQIIFLRERLFRLPLDRFRPLGDPTRHLGALLDLVSRAKDEDVSPEAYAAWAEARAALAETPDERDEVAKQAEVAAQLDIARQDIIVQAYLRDYARKNPITEAEIQKEYDRAKAQHGDKEYKARHILVETEDQAKKLISDLKKGGKFDDLATKNSKDTGSAQRGGDLDWNVPATYDKQFADAMTKLEKGKYTETPVQTRFGYHIIQLDDVRAARFASLAEVKPRIQQALAQQKIDELVKGLRAKAKVE
jgi:peptidyl-prolyl cis-trans isomerase C